MEIFINCEIMNVTAIVTAIVTAVSQSVITQIKHNHQHLRLARQHVFVRIRIILGIPPNLK